MIPFSKPELDLSDEEIKEIGNVLKSGQLCKGKYVEELENYFVEECCVKYAKVCCNATNGLLVALNAIGLRDSYVALPVFTWPSTLYAIENSGNYPIWYDIDKHTWNLCTKKPWIDESGVHLSKYCKKYVRPFEYEGEVTIKCVMPVDIFGNVAYTNVPTSAITVYDAAHGFGNPFLGNRGLVEVVSFSFTKPITAGGQGGVILTNNKHLHGRISETVDLSAKMGEVNAFVALSCIEKYPEKQKKRLEIIDKYRENIKVPFVEQEVEYSTNHSVFSILFESNEKRNKVIEAFNKNGVEVKCYYEPLVIGFKNSDYVYSRIISLPVYTSVEKHVKFISKLINEA